MKTQNQSAITRFLSNPAMTAYEFETEIHNGIIKIPENVQIGETGRCRVILLSDRSADTFDGKDTGLTNQHERHIRRKRLADASKLVLSDYSYDKELTCFT